MTTYLRNAIQQISHMLRIFSCVDNATDVIYVLSLGVYRDSEGFICS